MTNDEEREPDGTLDDSEKRNRPEPRNPFQEKPGSARDDIPALIDSKRSAAVIGVVTGLVFLILIVALCVFANIAFGN